MTKCQKTTRCYQIYLLLLSFTVIFFPFFARAIFRNQQNFIIQYIFGVVSLFWPLIKIKTGVHIYSCIIFYNFIMISKLWICSIATSYFFRLLTFLVQISFRSPLPFISLGKVTYYSPTRVGCYRLPVLSKGFDSVPKL